MDWLETPGGRVPRISSQLTFTDHLGSCKARWGIGRMTLIVPPGLYALGVPGGDDPVVVTANYKMSYDLVRQALSGRNCWLLVLETHGVNVWCAAGKGTFGTGEVIKRVIVSGLAKIVTHRRLLLPIFGAPGVAAHKVRQRCGFTVSYAAIRAADLPEYLDNGMVTTAAMRQLTFTFYERLVLVPVEIVLSLKTTLAIGAAVAVAAALGSSMSGAVLALTAYLCAVLAGLVVAPLLLPWLPSRWFSVKGAVVGLVAAGVVCQAGGIRSVPVIVAAALAMAAISSYHSLNFTGCTPFASRSGVKTEMRRALPVIGGALLVSMALLVWAKFTCG
jgi:acetyl-CoA decarbonylase/synthase complex subunit gamma